MSGLETYRDKGVDYWIDRCWESEHWQENLQTTIQHLCQCIKSTPKGYRVDPDRLAEFERVIARVQGAPGINKKAFTHIGVSAGETLEYKSVLGAKKAYEDAKQGK